MTRSWLAKTIKRMSAVLIFLVVFSLQLITKKKKNENKLKLNLNKREKGFS
jgi:hypothetical protein